MTLQSRIPYVSCFAREIKNPVSFHGIAAELANRHGVLKNHSRVDKFKNIY
jgi:hypothetical protein